MPCQRAPDHRPRGSGRRARNLPVVPVLRTARDSPHSYGLIGSSVLTDKEKCRDCRKMAVLRAVGADPCRLQAAVKELASFAPSRLPKRRGSRASGARRIPRKTAQRNELEDKIVSR
jgi:hypothetical protein